MAKSKIRLIKSVDELREALAEDIHEFAIALNYGVKSCKTIYLHKDGKRFRILNNVDDTKQILSEKQLMDDSQTNIGKAMEKNDFYVDQEILCGNCGRPATHSAGGTNRCDRCNE